MDESKHEIHSQVDAITAGTASVVNLTAGQSHGHDQGGCIPIWDMNQQGFELLQNKMIYLRLYSRARLHCTLLHVGIHWKGMKVFKEW